MKSQKQIDCEFRKVIHELALDKEKYVIDPQKDFTRNRKLTFEGTAHAILSIQGGSLNKELLSYSRCTNNHFTSSAFIQQRGKIKPEFFRDLLIKFNSCSHEKRKYKGYDLYAADGTDINIPRDPDSDSFVSSKTNPEGYNLLHMSVLYDLKNRTYTDCVIRSKNRADERKDLINMMQRCHFHHKSIIVVDRGYESYNMFAHFIHTDNVDFVCRVKQNQSLKCIRDLPMCECDRDISFEITTSQKKEDKNKNRIWTAANKKTGGESSSHWDFESPYLFNLRVVRIMLSTGNYETIITSLPRNQFSADDIKEIYHLRWGIETSFRKLKYVIGLAHLHCKRIDFILQEIYAALVMYNYCERIAALAIVKKDHTKHQYKVNFTIAVSICRYYFVRNICPDSIIKEILRSTEPIRPNRVSPRKMKTKSFVSFTYRISA